MKFLEREVLWKRLFRNGMFNVRLNVPFPFYYKLFKIYYLFFYKNNVELCIIRKGRF